MTQPHPLTQRLTDAARITGTPAPRYTLATRMARYRVPGVAIAVVEQGRIAWAAGHGTTHHDGDPVEPDTRFQIASISKMLNALAVLALVAQGRLSLEGDVQQWLDDWHLPRPDGGRAAVTIPRLLSHTAGITVAARSPGHPADGPLPNLRHVLDGEPPANTPPIVIDARPGTQFGYCGGGATVLQHVVEQATGLEYGEAMQELVCTPWGLHHTTAAQLDPHHQRVAAGHDPLGAPIPGGRRAFTQVAAAGIWSTAVDLATVLIRIHETLAGRRDDVIDSELATTMLQPVLPGPHGLGPELIGRGAQRRFGHTGSNSGFRARFEAFRHRPDGVIILTNGDGGDSLIVETLAAVGDTFGWHCFKPRRIPARILEPTIAGRISGTYRFRDRLPVHIESDSDGLYATAPYGQRRLWTVTPNRFVDSETGTDIIAELPVDGGPSPSLTVAYRGQAIMTLERVD